MAGHRLLNLSGSQSPHMENGSSNKTHLRMPGGLEELLEVKHMARGETSTGLSQYPCCY